MKNIVIILRHVITPLFFCIFLILGLTAAMLSGVIEYAVIKELFSGNGYSFYIPLIIVITLEGCKLFLHYAIPSHKRIGDTGAHLVQKTIVKYVLVTFSLICTIIFVSNSLYKPNTVYENMESKKHEIEQQYQQELATEIALVKADADNSIQSEYALVESIRDELRTLTPVYRPKAAYNNYVNEKKRLESELKLAETDYETNKVSTIADRDEKIDQLKIKYSAEMQREIAAAAERFENISSGDNKYLSAALTFFVSVFMDGEYSRPTYYLCVLLIALIISIILELVISFAQGYIAIDGEKLKKLFSDETIPEAVKARANLMVKIVVQASIMLSLYLICQAFFEVMVTSQENIISAFISYVLSIILTSNRFLPSLNIGGSTESGNKVYDSVVKAKDLALPVVVQTLLCIVGFLLISVYWGHSVLDMMPTTIALSVGSIGGQIILQPKAA